MPYSEAEGSREQWWSGGWGAFLGVFVIAFASFICYQGALSSRFIYDDIDLIVLNTRIRDLDHLKELVAGGRPVRALTFMLDYAVWGLNPYGYHLTNIFLHIVGASLFFIFLRRIFKDAVLALGAALIFAVHPATTEAVVAVSHRKEMLAFIFIISSLFAYYSASRPDEAGENGELSKVRWFWYVLSFGFYLAALGSKQVAIVVPLLMWVMDFIFSGGRAIATLRRRWLFYAMPLVMPFLFFLVKMGDFRAFGEFPASGLFGAFYFKVVAVSAWSVTQYLRLMLWPVHLHVDYSFPTPSPAAIILGISIFAGLIALAIRLRRSPLWALGLFWIPINLAPVLNFIPANDPLAERYLYIPLAGGCLLIAALLRAGSERALARSLFKGLIFLSVAGISALWWILLSWRLSEITWIYGAVVGSGALALWASMRYIARGKYLGASVARVILAAIIISALMAGAPAFLSSHVHKNLLWTQEDYSKMMGEFQRMFPNQAAKVDPEKLRQYKGIRFGALINIAGLALVVGLLGGAKARKRDSGGFVVGATVIALMMGGLTVMRVGEWRVDRLLWISTLKENPDSVLASTNLGIAWRKAGDFSRAMWAYRRASRHDPQNALIHFDLGVALIRLNRIDEAREEFMQAVKWNPLHTEAHLNLGNIYQMKGQFTAAANEYRQVVQMDPSNARAWYNLALALRSLGNTSESFDACRRALALSPDYLKARQLCGFEGLNPSP